MSLKGQDVVVLLKLSLAEGRRWTYASLAVALAMSPSEVHNAVRRARRAGLLSDDLRPNREALLEFLVHGLKYTFAPERGGVTRGIPTAHGAPPLASELASDGELPPVWAHPGGEVRGVGLRPLYKAAPRAALNDSELYECLALIDAIRAGRARERTLAAKHLQRKLGGDRLQAA
jgi:hypothetical protein